VRTTSKHTFFFTDKDCFSNWYISPFVYKDIRFNCVEQFMMYSKARMFGDLEIAEKILRAEHPREQKALGREVKGFVQSVWDEKCENIVGVGAREKFLQNPALLSQLFNTKGTVLVEASGFDRIWGIGMRENDPGVDDESNWRGENRLGNVLTRVREHLLALNLEQAPEAVSEPLAPIAEPPRETFSAFRPRRR